MSSQPFRHTAEQVDRVKQSMRQAWNLPGAGYGEMAETLRPAVERLIDAAGIAPGARVLDGATGAGIAAIEAARRDAIVTGVDFAEELISVARELAGAAGQPAIHFDVGDIEDLPYDDASFDVVISSFGSIFAPRHDAVAYQLCRVLRPGGRLAFTAWLPEEPNCRLMTITARYTPPPPPGSFSVFDWSDPAHLDAMLGPYVEDISLIVDDVPWVASSPSDACDFLFQRALGPTMFVFQRLDLPQKLALHSDAIELLSTCMQADGTVRLSRPYVIVTARKPA
ncbi:MAG: methyltransferase domain-containing protein [Thermomicrobiales bacterium]